MAKRHDPELKPSASAAAQQRVTEIDKQVAALLSEKRAWATAIERERASHRVEPSSGSARAIGYPPKVTVSKQKANGASGAHSTGLRAMILSILAKDGPLKAKGIADRMRLRGFKVSGTTDLNVRVNNDLHKLAVAERVKRLTTGYVINEAPREDPSL